MCNFCTCDGECIEWLVEQVRALTAAVTELGDHADYTAAWIAVEQRVIDKLTARVTELEVRVVPLEGASQHYILHGYWDNCPETPDSYPEGGDPGIVIKDITQ